MIQTIGSRRQNFFKGIGRKTIYHPVIYCLAVLIGLASSATVPPAAAGTPPEAPANYSRLVQLLGQEDMDEPVFAFNEFEDTIDQSVVKDSLQYFNDRRDLIRKIRTDLGGGSVRWKLENFKQRLVFVPETRNEYARLYKDYCVDAINLILNETGLDNPYSQIVSLQQADPTPFENTGVTAFLVHNLAREYRGTYSFFRENPRKELSFALEGTYFTGEIGSYSSQLAIKEDGSIEFEHNKYTIWQDSAQLPYNVLIVPIEETLHISLRAHTERAIRNDVQNPVSATPPDVEKIVEHWIAVEEALVGGLVDVLFPKIVATFFDEFSSDEISKGLESKLGFEKYRHLPAGIRIVQQAGYKQAVDLYTRDPRQIEEMLRQLEKKSHEGQS